VAKTLEHHKSSNCPVCLTQVHALSNELNWTDREWERLYKMAGWIQMRGAYGREVWVCSDACAKARMKSLAHV